MNACVTPLDPPRKPRECTDGRMADLATLPVFHKLTGRRVLLAAGNAGAAWKAELLAAAGAHVDVYTADPSSELTSLIVEWPSRFTLHRRPWCIHDFSCVALAVGALNDPAEAQAFRCAAKAAGVQVNVVDRPALCDFTFGTIVNRSPLVIGISTDGATPVFAQAIRARIETLLPQRFARWMRAARDWRPRVLALDLPFPVRRAFWQRLTDIALSRPNQTPDETTFQDILAGTLARGAEAQRGSIAIVGAGPGEPELLTLRAVRLLQAADVVLYDDLVTAGVIAMARREAGKIAVGKRGGRASCRQDDICRLMVELACAGKRVVRLKGGDPAVFGRLDEELEAAHAAGFTPEVVPGITAASGAAASLGLSLTRRRVSPRLQFITAHGVDGGVPEGLDIAALADPHATTCVYMGGRTLSDLARDLIARGLPETWPVMLVANVSRDDEKRVPTTLAGLVAGATAPVVNTPVLAIIGEVARMEHSDAELSQEAIPAH
jgi:uroporphyrin-III C-methyltransferase/precorrin-2 dehydrogenase/sirohydrochlorin ferrochelatase